MNRGGERSGFLKELSTLAVSRYLLFAHRVTDSRNTMSCLEPDTVLSHFLNPMLCCLSPEEEARMTSSCSLQ